MTLNEKMKKRHSELQTELASGKKKLDLLEEQKASLQSTLLRISGAIQVIEELETEESCQGNNYVREMNAAIEE